MKITLNVPPQRKRWIFQTANRKQRGIAIVTVMAVVVLMSTLVLSFFAMSKHEQVSARLNSAILKNYGVRDVALNFAIGQLRQATTWRDPGDPQAYTVWTSQPGMIRTFKENGDPANMFKLYSAKEMITSSSRSQDAILAEDLQRGWNAFPAVWADLNKPVYKPSANPADGTTGSSRQGELVYPIIDPSIYSPGNGSQDQAEGFSYDDGVMEGVDSRANQLAMPVRWIYMLADGTMGTVDNQGTFSATGGGQVSMDNPMVARFAFWADDESCKVNINTASEGVFWDTPRAATPEDAFYAEVQPTKNEFQRFPGHPATVCLSSVLFPNRRFYPAYEAFDMTNTTSDTMRKLNGNEMAFLWDIAPRISYKGGTIDQVKGSGRLIRADLSRTTTIVKNTPTDNRDDRMFSSPDEMLFRAYAQVSATGGSGNNLERALFTEELDGYNSPFPQKAEFVRAVKRGQFLLTAKSAAPEVNMFGHPRISLWPVDIAVPGMLFDATKVTGAAGDRVTPYDTTIARAAMIVKEAANGGNVTNNDNFYFLTRNAPSSGSRHGELQTQTDSRKRVLQMFKYLKRATGEGVDGSTFASRFPGIAAEKSFLDKYKMVGTLTTGSASNPKYSDRDVILANMLDYLRTTNLSDPYLKVDDRYGVAASGGKFYGGQNTSYCFCGWDNLSGSTRHLNVYSDPSDPLPKGIGRVATVSEAAFIVQLVGTYDSGGNLSTPFNASNWNGTTTGLPTGNPQLANCRAYELGMVVEAFIPGHGAAGVTPRVAANLSYGPPLVSSAATMTAMPISVTGRAPTLNAVLTPFAPASSFVTETAYGDTGLSEYSRFGGFGGLRPYANSVPGNGKGLAVITFRPFAIQSNSGKFEISFLNTATTGGMWRLQLFDNSKNSIAASDSDLVQCLYFKMDASMKMDVTNLNSPGGRSLSEQVATKFRTPTSPSGWLGNVGTQIAMQSFVIPHGDYRMTAASRTLGRGTPPTTSGGTPVFWNSLVPLPPNQHTLWEPNFGWESTSVGFGALCEGHRTITSGTPAKKFRPDVPFSYQQYKGYLQEPAFLSTIETDRGPADPLFTGDFDQGVGSDPDGPYINRIDEGDMRPFFYGDNSSKPYFDKLNRDTDDGKPGKAGSGGRDMSAGFGPNKLVRSAVQFGSLPTGVNSNWPWQTLLFRPDPGAFPASRARTEGHYGGARQDNPSMSRNQRMPKDHMMLDFFWMPVVEPYALSASFATRGKINMNYQIWPFNYIHRSTALHALFKSERIMAIPDTEAASYKDKASITSNNKRYRHFIDAKRTLNQFERKFRAEGEFDGDQARVFKFPSEICELWLVPESPDVSSANIYRPGELNAASPGNYSDNSYELMANWWRTRTLTGDNTKETPYANLYPRLTTKSNVFKVFMWVQTIQKLTSTPAGRFVEGRDQVSSEYRGSAIVERTLDTTDPELQNNDFFTSREAFNDPRKSLDYYYSYRVTDVKQFNP